MPGSSASVYRIKIRKLVSGNRSVWVQEGLLTNAGYSEEPDSRARCCEKATRLATGSPVRSWRAVTIRRGSIFPIISKHGLLEKS